MIVMAVITVMPVFPVMTEAGMPNLLPEADVKPDVTHYHLHVATNFFLLAILYRYLIGACCQHSVTTFINIYYSQVSFP